MNIELQFFLAFLLLVLALAWWRPKYMFLIWPIPLLVFQTTRTMVGSAPFYWYDAVSLIVLARLYIGRDLRSWPKGMPRWHWWFIGVALIFGTLFPNVRYGMSMQIFWIFGHASIAWMAFPIGLALFISPRAAEFRRYLAFGILISLLAMAVIASLQFGDEAMAVAVNKFYFQDMKGSLRLVEDLVAKQSSARVNGPYGGPNEFGGTTAIAAAICLLLFIESSKRLAYLSLALAAVVVVDTVSRQVLVATAAGFFVAFIFGTLSGRIQITTAVLLLVLITLITGISGQWAKRFSKWEGGIDRDINVMGRLVIGPQRLLSVINYDASVLITGVGLDVQKLAKKASKETDDIGFYRMGFVSNSFLLSLYYLGISGFLLTLTFWLWVLYKSLRVPRHARAPGVGCAVTAMLLIASDNYAFLLEVTVAMLFVLAAVIAGRCKKFQEAV